MIAHELLHIEFPKSERDENNCLIPFIGQDGRPEVRIKLRRHDIYVGGFAAVTERYGDSSGCKKALDLANSRMRQLPLPLRRRRSRRKKRLSRSAI